MRVVSGGLDHPEKIVDFPEKIGFYFYHGNLRVPPPMPPPNEYGLFKGF